MDVGQVTLGVERGEVLASGNYCGNKREKKKNKVICNGLRLCC